MASSTQQQQQAPSIADHAGLSCLICLHGATPTEWAALQWALVIHDMRSE
ncbi:MAG TPA: hypothetical protein VGR71_16710 [Nitrospira sp.]|nr:hypothetical protein [Nitrospira sp.]